MNIFKKKEIVRNSRDYNKFKDLFESLGEIDFQSTINELYTLEHTLKFYEKNSPDWHVK